MNTTMKTAELTGAALDWAAAKCEGATNLRYDTVATWWVDLDGEPRALSSGWSPRQSWHPSTNWSQGGPIIEREGITIIRLDDQHIPDAKGFWTGEKVPEWGAVIGDRHSPEEQYGSQGDYWGRSYHVDGNAVCGQTPLIAAMRCYVASKLGAEIEIPRELTK